MRIMIKFKTGNTKILAIIFISCTISAVFMVAEAIVTYDTDKTKSLGLVTLAGLILETGGFITLLSPQIIRIFTKKESNLTYEGVGLIILGTILQGIAVYLSL